MACGSSGRSNNTASKGFDLGSDDILCSYDDNYSNQDTSNGTHVDKEFRKSRMARSSVIPAASYSPPEDNNQDVISTVERTMKKHAENLMRFLEGISSRLSQLELYCYNLDKSIGEMRSDLIRDHGEADTKLKSLEKHLQEVHRSVQILRDKQELAETQKELAKLQLAQKESSSTSHAQQNEEKAVPPVSDPKREDNASDLRGEQLALALPHQIPQQPVFHTRPSEQQQQPMAPPQQQPQSVLPHSISQSQGYYLPCPQMPNLPAAGQQTPGQYLPSDSQYSPAPAPQMQDLSRVVPQPTQSQVNQASQVQSLPQYQQQWPQRVPQQAQPPQQPSMQPQIRPSSTAVYPHMPSQPSSQEILPGSMPMRLPLSGVSQSGASVIRTETMPYGYDGTGRSVQVQPPLQHVKAPFGAQQGDGYAVAGQQPSLSLGNAYMIYGEGGRAHHSTPRPHFPQGVYPPNSVPLQNPQPSTVRPQLTHSHPYNELIDKLVSMGYRGDHVVSVIHRLEESGQPVDFNAVLDRLNGRSSEGSQRGWSG